MLQYNSNDVQAYSNHYWIILTQYRNWLIQTFMQLFTQTICFACKRWSIVYFLNFSHLSYPEGNTSEQFQSVGYEAFVELNFVELKFTV